MTVIKKQLAFFLFLAITLTSCGYAEVLSITRQRELQQFVNEFYDLYGVQYHGTFKITTDPHNVLFKDSYVLAVCIVVGDKEQFRSIYVRESFFYLSREIARRAVMYHELGHCTKPKLPHSEEDIYVHPKSSCPYSLMNAYIPSDSCLTTYWDHYIIELGNRLKQ